ncbi:hypothetical protein TKK_0006677 [Trichogramma kaykai]
MSKDELEQTTKSISNLTLSDDDKQENTQPANDEPDLESRTEQNRDESPRINADNSSGPINKLHEDCLAEVFRYLHYDERIKLERVCSHWQVCSVRSWNTITKKGLMDFMFAQNNLTDDIILRILERSTIYLKELCLCFADHNITNPGNAVRIRRNRGPLIFQLLEERAANLKRICWDFVAPGEYVVPFLLKRVSQFKELFICPVVPAISLKNYKNIFEKATDLKKLVCSNVIQFNRQEEIMKFLDLWPSTLVSIHLVNIDCNSSVTSIVKKLQRISSLKELKLMQLCKSTQLNFWEHLSNLTVLDIGGGNLHQSCFPNMLNYFKKNKQLKSLSLYDIENICDEDLIALRYLTNLEEVQLASLHRITGRFLLSLPRSVNSLNISQCCLMEAEFLKNYIFSAPLLHTVFTCSYGETFQKCVFEGIETRLKSSDDQNSRDHRCKIFTWYYSSRHGSPENTYYYQAFRSCKMQCKKTVY